MLTPNIPAYPGSTQRIRPGELDETISAEGLAYVCSRAPFLISLHLRGVLATEAHVAAFPDHLVNLTFGPDHDLDVGGLARLTALESLSMGGRRRITELPVASFPVLRRLKLVYVTVGRLLVWVDAFFFFFVCLCVYFG